MITIPPLFTSSPLVASRSDASYWQKQVSDLYQQMKEHQNLVAPSRTLSSAASLTSLSIDISASSSTYFEVLYVGKIKVWNRKVPNTFIDDALEKFRLHDQERSKNEGNSYRRGSMDATNLTPIINKVAQNYPQLQRSLTLNSITLKPANVETDTRPPQGQTDDSHDLEDSQDLKLPAPEDHNRTMVLQVGRTDMRLISPDRKLVLLHKLNRDIATCVQGQTSACHFGFICREGNLNTFIGYVFKCESDSVANEAVGAITQALSNVELKQTRPSVSSCEHCPMVWFHKLCVEIETLTDDRRVQAVIFRRIDQLEEEEQKVILTKFQGAETDSIRDQNEFLMMLLRAHCEMKQGRHVHDTAENRSEFLNQYLGGSTIFMKAKKSLSNSFDTFLKRRTSNNDIAATLKDNMTLNLTSNKESPSNRSPSTSFNADNSDRDSDGSRSRSSTIGSHNDLKVKPSDGSVNGSEKGGLKSPMIDIFMKVGSSSKSSTAEMEPGTWRQAIFKRVAVPKNENFEKKRKRTKEEFHLLWKKAIHQAVLLVRMEKENAKIRAKQEENAVKRIKLEYDEMRSVPNDNIEIWDLITNKESRATLKHDSNLLFQAIRQGIPRSRRGEVWMWLADRWCKRNPPLDVARFPNYSVSYDTLLKQLTSHQHAILIDLGRTFPSHSYFSSPLGPGQLALFNLLKAYSLLDPEVGYCQGLSFVAGVLLLHMEESQAFFLLRHLMFRRGLRKQYLPDMLCLQVKLYQLSRLIHDQLPDLYSHFDFYEVSPTLYAAPWILTLFASQFPLGFVSRVFDLIFLENTDVVFKVALVLLALHEENLLKCDSFEEIMTYLKVKLTEFDKVSLEKVMKEVCITDINRQLNEYQVEYAVLQEEMISVQPQVEQLKRYETLNRTLNDQNKALTGQLEMALANVQRLEKNRTLQQSNVNRLEMHSRGLEVTVATLGSFIQNMIDQKIDIEIPDDVRRILSQITFSERRRSQPQTNFMKMFGGSNKKTDMIKSLSTGRLALKQMKEAQEMVRSRSLIGNNLKQELQILGEEPQQQQLLAPPTTKTSHFFSNSHNQILNNRLRAPKIDITIQDCHNNRTNSDCSDIKLPLESKSTSLPLGNDKIPYDFAGESVSPTNSEDSGVGTPVSPKDQQYCHPLGNCDVQFAYQGTKQLKNIRSLRNTSRNSSPDLLKKA